MKCECDSERSSKKNLRSESRLAAPIALTPGRNQRCSSGPALRRRSLDAEPARLDGSYRSRNPQPEPPAASELQAEATKDVGLGRRHDGSVPVLQLDALLRRRRC